MVVVVTIEIELPLDLVEFGCVMVFAMVKNPWRKLNDASFLTLSDSPWLNQPV